MKKWQISNRSLTSYTEGKLDFRVASHIFLFQSSNHCTDLLWLLRQTLYWSNQNQSNKHMACIHRHTITCTLSFVLWRYNCWVTSKNYYYGEKQPILVSTFNITYYHLRWYDMVWYRPLHYSLQYRLKNTLSIFIGGGLQIWSGFSKTFFYRYC